MKHISDIQTYFCFNTQTQNSCIWIATSHEESREEQNKDDDLNLKKKIIYRIVNEGATLKEIHFKGFIQRASVTFVWG